MKSARFIGGSSGASSSSRRMEMATTTTVKVVVISPNTVCRARRERAVSERSLGGARSQRRPLRSEAHVWRRGVAQQVWVGGGGAV
eukprot:4889406-Prymnesium_polylepis.1